MFSSCCYFSNHLIFLVIIQAKMESNQRNNLSKGAGGTHFQIGPTVLMKFPSYDAFCSIVVLRLNIPLMLAMKSEILYLQMFPNKTINDMI